MNRLAHEASLYLRQHQANPVDWYPWGEEAFARAREQDLPILLSVGYSSCHWCHVMAHECFENEQLAAVQNRLFVSIKVDREERPDVDRVYMEALQALTGSGGWPMTMFLLPDGRPFYGGTYFPAHDRAGLPGFGRVMASVAEVYRARHEEAVRVAADLSRALLPRPPAAPASEPLSAAALDRCATALVAAADPAHGGVGGGPKFPQAPLLEFLLTRFALAADEEALRTVHLTLRRMAEGGINDQLGGGFHRYSVDDRWGVPHFEKMLYDQAHLIACYLHLHLLQGEPGALRTARRTADFVLAELRLENGGFAASLDADTEAGEGATYAWTERELTDAAAGDAPLLRQLVRLDPRAQVDGRFVLQSAAGWGEPSTPGAPADQLDRLRARLLEARRRRPQPARDEKLVVAWNASTVAALSELGVATGESRYREAAEAGAHLLLDAAGGPRGRLPHLVGNPSGQLPAQLADLAHTALMALQLHEASGRELWFDWALELARQANQEMGDSAQGLWFDVAAGRDPLLPVRPMSLEDGAERCGSSLMAEVCLRLHALTGEPAWMERAEAALATLAPAAERVPQAMGGWLHTAQLYRAGMGELAVVIPGPPPPQLELVRAARRRHRPNLVVAVGQWEGGQAVGPPLARDRAPLGDRPTAFVCRGFTCQLPTDDVEVMLGQLEAGPAGQRPGPSPGERSGSGATIS